MQEIYVYTSMYSYSYSLCVAAECQPCMMIHDNCTNTNVKLYHNKLNGSFSYPCTVASYLHVCMHKKPKAYTRVIIWGGSRIC